MTTNTISDTANKRPLRIAIEGCGHGTLDAIYASIIRGCEAKGWDGVDLVIICGDFQAVRNRCDLNVTAMPAKYREMADFHQYYWGKKRAPFTTIFIGGNHEASNHLWELYYGGWVAPNIYYLGAANVIQFGSLRIASMSGIWKGYDYKKPHYERLPYSADDMYSIYHVRELDVRKLLAYRSQVDIGLSHDWPRGIEWLGNHRQLFQHKAFLKDDAEEGKLGNVAAKEVLDHLRPAYWFSAHLHVRYTAIKRHVQDEPLEPETSSLGDAQSQIKTDPANGQRLAAWRNFGATAKEDEALQTAQHLQEQSLRREEVERTGMPLDADTRYTETYKKVKLADGFSRTVTAVTTTQSDGPASIDDTRIMQDQIPQLDGSLVSRPSKRQHSPDDSSKQSTETSHQIYMSINSDGPSTAYSTPTVSKNPDAIDLDSTDDEDNQAASTNAMPSKEIGEAPLLDDKQDRQNEMSNLSTQARQSGLDNLEHGQQHQVLDSGGPQAGDGESNQPTVEEEVSEEMRAQLAALSTKFAEPSQSEKSAPLPHSEFIKNTTTKFLALSKCAPGQRFLQLMEIEPYNEDTLSNFPPTLRYDPEWLAILRVFSSELTLGGDGRSPVPAHRGDTYYRDRILEEQSWIEEHVVGKGLLTVPNNFVNTLAHVDRSDPSSMSEMPYEETNPQTTAFCRLIGIDNKFDMSESDRQGRRARGPSESNSSQRGRGSFGGHHGGRGGRGGNRGRGGRGGWGRGGRH